jgi:TetR/AcrR family transcriptional regulator
VADAQIRSNDRILLKALALFSEKGYDATSVREICEAAAVTKPTLYHFYGSKEGVYRAIVDGALERVGRELRGVLERDQPIRDQLVAVALTWIVATTREPDLARFVIGLTHNPPHSAPATDFVGFYRRTVAGVAAVVERSIARGELAPGPTDVRMLVFMGALSEAMHGFLLTGEPQLTPELAETLVDTIIRGWGFAAPASS